MDCSMIFQKLGIIYANPRFKKKNWLAVRIKQSVYYFLLSSSIHRRYL